MQASASTGDPKTSVSDRRQMCLPSAIMTRQIDSSPKSEASRVVVGAKLSSARRSEAVVSQSDRRSRRALDAGNRCRPGAKMTGVPGSARQSERQRHSYHGDPYCDR